MHASDAAALFLPADEEEDVEDEGPGGEEQDVEGWDSRGGSPIEEGDQDAPVRYLLFLKEEFY
jgi:hypothetical protein